MREGITARHRRDKEFVMDLPIHDTTMLSPREVEKILSDDSKFPVYDTGKHGKRIGDLSVRQFLEKFG